MGPESQLPSVPLYVWCCSCVCDTQMNVNAWRGEINTSVSLSYSLCKVSQPIFCFSRAQHTCGVHTHADQGTHIHKVMHTLWIHFPHCCFPSLEALNKQTPITCLCEFKVSLAYISRSKKKKQFRDPVSIKVFLKKIKNN